MTLREELARRLKNAIKVPGGFDPDPPDSPLGDWTAVADECIRQMEWARRPEREMEVMEMWEGGERHPSIVRNLPLTLAPDDWKAE